MFILFIFGIFCVSFFLTAPTASTGTDLSGNLHCAKNFCLIGLSQFYHFYRISVVVIDRFYTRSEIVFIVADIYPSFFS